MSADKKSREYIICPCRNVTRGAVEDVMRERKITDLKELCEAAGVGNKCGGCRESIDQMIEEYKKEL